MCIVIDTNSLSCVFDPENDNHADFRPVLDWIVYGKGKVVYGGTTYERELRTAYRFVKILSEFQKANKVVVIDEIAVDSREEEVKALVNHRDFDDPHIVAILAVSGVKLVCTNDRRAIPFLTNISFYRGRKKPKVYMSSRNANLLCDSNIVACCQPTIRLNKSACEHLGFD